MVVESAGCNDDDVVARLDSCLRVECLSRELFVARLCFLALSLCLMMRVRCVARVFVY